MMHIWNVATQINNSGAMNTPFRIKFVKTDGTIREMVAIKNNRHKDKATGQAKERSNFGYNLKEKFLLLLQECTEFKTSAIRRPGIGTIHGILNPIDDVSSFQYNENMLRPKSVALYSIIEYNGQEVIAS